MIIQTLATYTLLSLFFILLNIIAVKYKSFKIIILAITLYSILMGVRYGVGVDFFSYEDIYNTYAETGFFNYEKLEKGFALLIKLLVSFGADYSLFLAVIAFLQLYFIYKSLKPFEQVFPYLAFTFMVGCVWLDYANGLRQILAFSLFVYALHFSCKRNFALYISTVTVAYFFHSSAIILLLVYPMTSSLIKVSSLSVRIQLIILLIACLLMNLNLISLFINNFDFLISYLGYEYYIDGSYNNAVFGDQVGVGFYITLCINVCLISFSGKVKRMYPSKWFSIVYGLYYIGVIWYYVFLDSLLLSRVNYYMYGFHYIIAAFTLSYLYQYNKRYFLAVTSLYILTFIAVMYRMDINSAMFIFNWQHKLYFYKNI